jgi:ABC-type multidrug transport system ATPase subunit
VPPSLHINPYIAGKPVTGTEMFFGREDVFDFVQQNLTGPHANNPIVLYGQRRTGKTSVLYQLHRRLGPGYWCVFIDLHGLVLSDMGQLLQGIATLISRDLQRDHQVSVEVPDRGVFTADPASAFESVFLERVWAVLGDNQLILMLDEVTYVDEAVQDQRLKRGIFEYLRHLMQHRSQLNFVFSLGSGIEEMAKDYTLLFNVALYQKISFLKRPAARDLITVPAQDHYRLTDQAVDRILQVTSGHAYYTQLVCRCVFDAWKRNPVTVIEADAVDDVLSEAIELGSANLTYVWLDAAKDKEEQAVMAGLAAAMWDDGAPATTEEIRAAWRRADVHLPEQEINRALHKLISREVVAGSGPYSFAVDLQRLWIDKHRRIDWVKEDLTEAIAEWAASSPTIGSPGEPVTQPPSGWKDLGSDWAPDAGEPGESPAPPDASYAAPPLLVRTAHSVHRLESGREYRIGRDDRADIPLADARVSWEQAVLRAEGPVWVLEDLGSGAGTFVGADRVGRLEITLPYIVRFGDSVDGPLLRFHLDEELADQGAVAWRDTTYDTTFVPGVLRDTTSRGPIQSKVMKIGRRPDNDIVVNDLGVSNQHAELRLLPGGRYEIIDLGSHSGTFVNGTRVNQAVLHDEDIIAIGHTIFRLINGELIEYVDDGRATFEARDLQVAVQYGGKRKILLDGITFPLAERSFLAVIGPAGAGKSTLLNALTGKRPATTGSVFYDFRDLYENYDELRQRIGLVPQESVVHDQLTAKTALGYQAELRFPPDTGEAERNQRVGEVLDELSMTRHADTRIDRLSGGQRKRVNIAMELLTRPSLLFLDEPTSPLDPHLKRDMFTQMRRMADPNAATGQSVIVITHDVDHELIDQCDRLIVLQPGGKMAYFGPPADGLRFFGRNNWPDVFQAFADEPDRDFAAEYRQSPEFVKYVATPISVRLMRIGADRPESKEAHRPKQRGMLNQMFTMARRYRRVMLADRVHVLTTVLLPILLGILVRVTPNAYGLVNSIPGGFNVNAIQTLMILVLAAVLCGTANSIREFIKERDIYERERMMGLSATAYMFSKVMVLSLISVLQAAVIVILGLAGQQVPPSGVVIPGSAIIEIFVALAVLTVVSSLLGFAISTLVTKGDQTMPILVGVTMVQVALSGGLFPLTGAIGSVALIAPARWALGAVASTINLNSVQSSVSQGPNGQKPDALWTHDASHWLAAVLVMAGIGIVWLVIARLRLATIGPRKRK